MSEASFHALRNDLLSLRDALAQENYAQAGDVLALHDRRMRQYIDTVGFQAPLLALRELLQLQHRLHEQPAGNGTAADAGSRA
jgi:hypothetical protein